MIKVKIEILLNVKFHDGVKDQIQYLMLPFSLSPFYFVNISWKNLPNLPNKNKLFIENHKSKLILYCTFRQIYCPE